MTVYLSSLKIRPKIEKKFEKMLSLRPKANFKNDTIRHLSFEFISNY